MKITKHHYAMNTFLPKNGLCHIVYTVCVFIATGSFLVLFAGMYHVDERTIMPVNTTVSRMMESYSQLKALESERKIPSLAVSETDGEIGRFDTRYKTYTINGKPIIWAFWDSAEIPALIKLSLASVICHNEEDFHIEVLRMRNIHDWVDHVHPAFPFLIPAHKADYFRARVLDEYGGIYVDADSIGFGSFWTLYKKLFWYDLVNLAWSPDGDKISITTMGPMRARSKFTALWVTDLHLVLDSKYVNIIKYARDLNNSLEYPLEWAELLREVVVPIVDKMIGDKRLRYFSLNGPKTFGQLLVSNFDPLGQLSDEINNSFRFIDTELLMYHNSQFSEEVRSLSLDQLLDSTSLLMELVRMSFAKCRKVKLKKKMEVKRNSKYKLAVPNGSPRVQYVVPVLHKSLRHDKNLLKWIKKYVSQTSL